MFLLARQIWLKADIRKRNPKLFGSLTGLQKKSECNSGALIWQFGLTDECRIKTDVADRAAVSVQKQSRRW